MNKLSAVVTCYNNQDTIAQCINSLSCADEIMVLDSFSNDKTVTLLESLGCTVVQQKFKGFSQQKQDAINLASNDWVLLLDSDEFLDQQAQQMIQTWKRSKTMADAYHMPRREWVLWKWSHPWVRMNRFIRLFDKRKAIVSDDLVHESIQSSGAISALKATIFHRGETSVSKKIEKINRYSTLSAQQKYSQGKSVMPIKLVLYPVFYFLKQYIMRRQLFNGWVGLINASLNSRYAYLKYLKLYELQQNNKRNK